MDFVVKNYFKPALSATLLSVRVRDNTEKTLSISPLNHLSNSPKIYQRDINKKTPPDVLVFAYNNILDYYHKPEKWLNNLRYSRTTSRQQRSEAREAIASVCRVIVDHLNLATMQIVKWQPTKQQFRPLMVSEIAELAGIGYKRCIRALGALKKALYLKLNYRTKITPEGDIRALASIKTISKAFFYHLGVSQYKLDNCISYVRNKMTTVSKKIKKELNGRLKFIRRDAFKKGNGILKNINVDGKQREMNRKRKINLRKNWNNKALELKKADPNLTCADIVNKIGAHP